MNFIQEIFEFDKFGNKTQTECIDDIDYYINEFWTSRQRQANRIHEISYRACFKPQLPAFFINRLTRPGDVVYDPFMGRGTTPVEAALLNRIPFGNDVNPLSIALTEPRINPPDLNSILLRLDEIPWNEYQDIENDDLLVFYHPKTLAQIEGLRSWLIQREKDATLDMIDKWIRMVAINRLTGHSPGFFSVYSMPPNQAVSIKSQAKFNQRRNQKPPPRDVPQLIRKKSKTLLSQISARNNGEWFGSNEVNGAAQKYLFTNEQSHQTSQIPESSVDLVVTSPPFLDVVDYETDNWLRCWFLGVDSNTVEITKLKDVGTWQRFINATLIELSRVVRDGGHVAFEVGEVKSGTVQLEKHVVAAAQDTTFRVMGVMINQQAFTKTANLWGVVNNTMGTNSNRIILLKNEKSVRPTKS